MPGETDIAILGGGCAGLSLAYRLIGAGRHVTVIEPRARYDHDRVWSFFRMAPDPFEDCVVRRWHRWRVSAGDREAVRGAAEYGYETVGSGRFYAKCTQAIDRANDVGILTGTSAEIAGRQVGGVALALTGATEGRLTARHVIDTRPAQVRPCYGQYFVGLEVETAAPCFDPDICDLMAFGPPRRDRIDFVYVLPFSPTRALVEATAFGAAPPDRAGLEREAELALARHTGGADCHVLRREAGMIPMDIDHAERPADARIVPFGLRGGAARPSTGYAFARIQDMAETLANRIRGGHPPAPPRPDGHVTREMDRLFLNVIARRPERGPELFLRMFERAPPHRLERFLSGSTGCRDRLAVIGSLPAGLFLSHLVRP